MSPLMQAIYDYVSSRGMRSYMDLDEHAHVTACLTRMEETLKASLQEKEKTIFQSCLDMEMERSSMELEAMFQAAFAAARELG